jgi:diguanylate cyclase (GGDEF)-like protein
MARLRRCCFAILLAALLPALGGGAASGEGAGLSIQPGQAAPAVSLNPVPINPRTIAGVLDFLITGLVVLLYFYRRQRYIRYWIIGWVLAAMSMFVVAAPYTGWVGLLAFGLSQFLGILSALAFVVSADAYRARPHIKQEYAMGVLPLLLWFALAPIPLGREAVFVPGHLLTAGALVAAGFAYLVLLRRNRMLGATVVGAMLLTLAALNVWLAIAASDPVAPEVARVVLAMLGVHLVMALGMQLMTFEDMTFELRRTNRRLELAQGELQQLVTTDALTGCRNRRFFDDVIGRELQRHRRYHIPLSLLFVDVDRFKAINDTLGHDAGDRVLQGVATFLMRHVREADYVFRWGGDEFLILISCPEMEAIRKGTDLQAAFAASADAESLPPGVGLSVGVAEVPPGTGDIMDVVNQADERMYANKKAARTRRA